VFSVVVAAVLLLSASGCSLHGLHGSNDQGIVVGGGTYQWFPVERRGEPLELAGKDLDGKALALASMRGKPTVVNVWGSWCTGCHAEEPFLVDAEKKLGDQANFVGIDTQDNGTSQSKTYNARYGISWPSSFSPGGEALLTFSGVITPNSIPSTIVLDPQGRPAAAFIGPLPSSLSLVETVQKVMNSG
jgi:thiol-disulfide isomerase/thioredoxin